MPRAWNEYNRADWLRLRPLTHWFKTMRYHRIEAQYLGHVESDGAVSELRPRLLGQQVLVTIGFNDPYLIHWQCQLVAKHIPGAVHLVADNSSDEEASARMRALCAETGSLFVRLPANPWTGRNPSRSHGLAMNWTWRHLLLPARPVAFGFIDQDMMPLAPCDPFREFRAGCCWGDKRWAAGRWFLWAGYCFYDFDQVAARPLDFGLDWFIGLDTGGANWEVLYRHLDPSRLPERPIEPFAALPDVPLEDAYFERRGTWLHEVGCAGRRELRRRKRDAFTSFLRAA